MQASYSQSKSMDYQTSYHLKVCPEQYQAAESLEPI